MLTIKSKWEHKLNRIVILSLIMAIAACGGGGGGSGGSNNGGTGGSNNGGTGGQDGGDAGSGNEGESKASTVLIDSSTRYQTIRGFGAANTVFNGVGSYPNASDIQKSYGMGEDELGLSMFRISVPEDQYNWLAVADVAFLAQEAGALVFATPWNAPDDFYNKDNEDEAFVILPSRYGDWAAHLNSFDNYMKSQAVELYAIAIQNEPDIGEHWTNMTADEVFDFTKNYAGDINTRVISAESFNFNRAFYTQIFNDPQALANIDIVGGHIYGGGLGPIPQAEANGKEIWMTEYLLNDTEWNKVIPDWTEWDEQRKWTQSMKMLDTIHDSMEDNWNAYIWWYLKRYYSFIGEGEKGSSDGEILKRGYAFSHFSKFVRPGYTRIGVEQSVSGLDVTAYQGGGKIVVQLINTSADSPELKLDIPHMQLSNGVAYTTSLSKNRVKADVTITDGYPEYQVDADSITTLVFDYNESFSLAKAATQSSTSEGGEASRVVDGSRENAAAQSLSQTQEEANPWWQLDLGASLDLASVKITTPADCCVTSQDFHILLSDSDFSGQSLDDIVNDSGVSHVLIEDLAATVIELNDVGSGRYLRVQLGGTGVLSLAEVEVFVEPGTQDSDGDGVINSLDDFPYNSEFSLDSDDDGYADAVDSFPSDASENRDSDGDGVGNNADAFPRDSSETADSDNDGVGDNTDAFPNDPGKMYNQLAEAVVADTYVRAGGNSASNFGSEAILATKTGEGAFSRKTFLKIDVSALVDAELVLLQLVPQQVDGNATLSFDFLEDDTWGESSITWDNQVASSETISTVAGYVVDQAITIDITQQAKAQAAADGVLSIVIVNPTEQYVSFHSRENGSAEKQPTVLYR